MGLFDTLTIHGDDLGRFLCGAGHSLRELQTKELGEPKMDRYHLVRGGLYRELRAEEGGVPVFLGERLMIRRDTPTEAVAFSGEAEVYTVCESCEPVLYLSDPDHSFAGDMVRERRPAVGLAVRFEGGRLAEVLPIRAETRQQIAEQLARSGVEVLDDGDRLARRHRQVRERRGRGRDLW